MLREDSEIFRRYVLRQQIDRYWMHELTPPEYVVLSFVFDRTLGWGKTEERITVEHFQHGVRGTCCGTMLGRGAILKALKGLREKNLIVRVSQRRSGDTYSINLELITSRQEAVEGSTKRTAVVHEMDRDGPRDVPHKKETSEERKTEEHDKRSAPPSRDHSDEGIPSQKARRRTPPALNAKDGAGSTKVQDLRVIWEKAWRATYEGYPCPTWSPKARGQITTLVKGLDLGATPVSDFLDWVVRSWATVRATRLWWMKERPAPERPDVGFLVVFKDRFLDAWGDRATLHQEMGLTREQRLTRRNMREGMSYEQAKEAAARDTERADQRDRLAEERAEVGRSASALMRLRDELTAKERSLRIERGLAARERGEPRRSATSVPRVLVEIEDTDVEFMALPPGRFEDDPDEP